MGGLDCDFSTCSIMSRGMNVVLGVRGGAVGGAGLSCVCVCFTGLFYL